MTTPPNAAFQIVEDPRIGGERKSQRLVTAFIASGLIFMLLPGTFLGVWNLLDISQGHGPQLVPQAWLQAHGQAQIFGWIGSFILGIGFYSLTKMKTTKAFPARVAWISWILWTSGVLLRWIGGVTGDAWHEFLPFSAALQLAGFIAFYLAVRKHRPSSTDTKDKTWVRIIAFASIAFLIVLIINAWMLFHLALHGTSAALPHIRDEQFVMLSIWGILVPTIWGFNARWLPVFLGLKPTSPKTLYAAYIISIAAILTSFTRYLPVAQVLFLLAALLTIEALHVWERSIYPPKLLNVHRSFPLFVRIAYVWLVISCLLAIIATRWDFSGGYWGASRHTLTVGFVAMMVFAIGQRVLPAFCGMRILWSTRLMAWSLYLLLIGCFLRVLAEPLAYESIWTPAWHILPVSAVVELAAVTLFAINIGVTILRPPPTRAAAKQPPLMRVL